MCISHHGVAEEKSDRRAGVAPAARRVVPLPRDARTEWSGCWAGEAIAAQPRSGKNGCIAKARRLSSIAPAMSIAAGSAAAEMLISALRAMALVLLAARRARALHRGNISPADTLGRWRRRCLARSGD